MSSTLGHGELVFTNFHRVRGNAALGDCKVVARWFLEIQAMQSNDGGFVFPHETEHCVYHGMCVRAFIAKDVLAAMVGSRDTMSEIHDCAEDDDDAKRIASEEAVDYADALIAALNNRE